MCSSCSLASGKLFEHHCRSVKMLSVECWHITRKEYIACHKSSQLPALKKKSGKGKTCPSVSSCMCHFNCFLCQCNIKRSAFIKLQMHQAIKANSERIGSYGANSMIKTSIESISIPTHFFKGSWIIIRILSHFILKNRNVNHCHKLD